MMANNKISKAFESATAWAPTPAIYQEYKSYAAKLDRMVEAARWFNTHGHQIRHSDECLFWDGEEDDDIGPKCDCGKRAAVNELTVALSDIELPQESKD